MEKDFANCQPSDRGAREMRPPPGLSMVDVAYLRGDQYSRLDRSKAQRYESLVPESSQAHFKQVEYTSAENVDYVSDDPAPALNFHSRPSYKPTQSSSGADHQSDPCPTQADYDSHVIFESEIRHNGNRTRLDTTVFTDIFKGYSHRSPHHHQRHRHREGFRGRRDKIDDDLRSSRNRGFAANYTHSASFVAGDGFPYHITKTWTPSDKSPGSNRRPKDAYQDEARISESRRPNHRARTSDRCTGRDRTKMPYPRVKCEEFFGSTDTTRGASRHREHNQSSRSGKYHGQTREGINGQDKRSHHDHHAYQTEEQSNRGSDEQSSSKSKRPATPARHEPAPPIDVVNHYATLGISFDAGDTEIKRAARKKRVDVHPDRLKKPDMNTEQLNQIDDMSKKVGEAAEVLGDETTKNNYDKMLKTFGGPQC